ncbi:MAG: AbrB/MazE/SpoVT family DNA-binding domain-containing protein [Actinomycetota bacterium]
MTVRISRGGQISIPAEIRRKWAAEYLVLEDYGDRLVLRPIPKDPIKAARGAFPEAKGKTRRAMERYRREERDAERRKWS